LGVVTDAIATTSVVAIVSIAMTLAFLFTPIATRRSCSNTFQLQRSLVVAIVVIATRRTPPEWLLLGDDFIATTFFIGCYREVVNCNVFKWLL
jgi:hypothetical protein